MAWIESHQDLDDHPKTRKAALLLGISVPTVIGHLHILWHWALSYAQDGDLTDFSNADIALAARWEGDPDLFVKSLTDCRLGNGRAGFLEVVDGRTMIHDWWDYAGKLIDKRKTDALRKRASRLSDVHKMSAGHPAEGAGTVPTVPTEQNSTNNTNNTQPDAAENDIPQTEPQFEESPFSHMSAVVANSIGLPELTGGPQKWLDAIKELVEADVTDTDVGAAVKWMTENRRSIIGARSIVNPCLIAKSHRIRAVTQAGGAQGGHLEPINDAAGGFHV
ncbi:hypothetical protein EHM92_09060 [bacterium]|nr:MAG: hypothetical protein EHM92_09060 [bacterium]